MKVGMTAFVGSMICLCSGMASAVNTPESCFGEVPTVIAPSPEYPVQYRFGGLVVRVVAKQDHMVIRLVKPVRKVVFQVLLKAENIRVCMDDQVNNAVVQRVIGTDHFIATSRGNDIVDCYQAKCHVWLGEGNDWFEGQDGTFNLGGGNDRAVIWPNTFAYLDCGFGRDVVDIVGPTHTVLLRDQCESERYPVRTVEE